MSTIDLSNSEELDRVIGQLATCPRLLVTSDFDGTIAAFTRYYDETVLDPLARSALLNLATLSETFVTIISGRALSDLATRFHEMALIRLVGSHGHEFDLEMEPLTLELAMQLECARILVAESVERCPGARLEAKPHGVVFHFRECHTRPAEELDSLKRKLTELGVGAIRDGSCVLEYSVVLSNKGDAVKRLREEISPTRILFIGDDVTDEAAFRKMSATDISIKVGIEETSARYRVTSYPDAVEFLVRLAKERAAWQEKNSSQPPAPSEFVTLQKD